MERLKTLSLIWLIMPFFAVISDLHVWYTDNDGFWKSEAETTSFVLSDLGTLWARHFPKGLVGVERIVSDNPGLDPLYSILFWPAPVALILPSILFYVLYRVTQKADRKKAQSYEYKRD